MRTWWSWQRARRTRRWWRRCSRTQARSRGWPRGVPGQWVASQAALDEQGACLIARRLAAANRRLASRNRSQPPPLCRAPAAGGHRCARRRRRPAARPARLAAPAPAAGGVRAGRARGARVHASGARHAAAGARHLRRRQRPVQPPRRPRLPVRVLLQGVHPAQHGRTAALLRRAGARGGDGASDGAGALRGRTLSCCSRALLCACFLLSRPGLSWQHPRWPNRAGGCCLAPAAERCPAHRLHLVAQVGAGRSTPCAHIRRSQRPPSTKPAGPSAGPGQRRAAAAWAQHPPGQPAGGAMRRRPVQPCGCGRPSAGRRVGHIPCERRGGGLGARLTPAAHAGRPGAVVGGAAAAAEMPC